MREKKMAGNSWKLNKNGVFFEKWGDRDRKRFITAFTSVTTENNNKIGWGV